MQPRDYQTSLTKCLETYPRRCTHSTYRVRYSRCIARHRLLEASPSCWSPATCAIAGCPELHATHTQYYSTDSSFRVCCPPCGRCRVPSTIFQAKHSVGPGHSYPHPVRMNKSAVLISTSGRQHTLGALRDLCTPRKPHDRREFA